MTDTEKREAARQFYNKWAGKGKEDEDDRSYWLDILQRIMGAADATDRIDFQKKVIVDGHTKRIDAYIPETKIIIEQKSLGIALDKKSIQSGGIQLTPYEQAKRYNDNLPSSEKARWIITSNFGEIWIYDMDTKVPEQNITKISIRDLQNHYSMLDLLLNKEVKQITKEMELSLQAGELVGKIHDCFLKQYNDPTTPETQHSLNILCVRLVFCLYAEDAGLFGQKDAFSNYIDQFEPGKIRRALLDLFEVLNTPLNQRKKMYLDDDLAAFPYCNGGLFARENIEIPKITQEIKDTLIDSGRFDWSRISPTIFGAVFESTLNPETRRSGGMHYTSIENIHKVIDPLFLDNLKSEFESLCKITVEKIKKVNLEAFQDKLANLNFFDPACGSGNFLTETYISLRRLENQILSELYNGQISFGFEESNPIKISINQFYGIEINDFAVTVAKTALWIAESQMLKETEDIVHMHLDFLPLKTNATIIEGNALHTDWEKIIPNHKLSYILGNPPFVGQTLRTKEQSSDMAYIFGKGAPENKLDYVICWYKKAIDYIKNNQNILIAFVSTDSICQGESVPTFWKDLLKNGAEIIFAYRSFKWESESSDSASVRCVIIGLSPVPCRRTKVIFDENQKIEAININPYLIDAPNIWLESRGKRILGGLEKLTKGSEPSDGGNLFLSENEAKTFLLKYNEFEKYIKPFVGAKEFIHDKNGSFSRYCFWLKGVKPSLLTSNKELVSRLNSIREKRNNSTADRIKKMADYPYLFSQIRQPETSYIIIPETTGSTRRYIPMGFFQPSVIAGNSTLIAPNLSIYHFGVLTSNVHMAWMRVVCGRMNTSYRYSPQVYNNFPWPTPTAEQKTKIEQTAQGILQARKLYPDSSLADLYNPLTMPPELRKAHTANDKAVMQAYGFNIRNTSEADCVAHLMKLYQDLTDQENAAEAAPKGKKKKK